MRSARLVPVVVLVVVLFSGCGAGYLVRAGWTEARILWRREPITDVLARPGLDPALRERLELVLAVRRFAVEELGLAAGESFTTFAEVDWDTTVHVLSAAWRDRLESYTWWYPIVGRVPYRGFFDRAGADDAARALEHDGLDVDVRPATAFSTLGWFADPLLSTTVRTGPVSLAETVVHELFHATLYVPGRAVFNESAATFVGYRGAIAYFCTHAPDPDHCRAARERWALVRAHGRVVGHYLRRLDRLYAARLPAADREARRRQLASRAGRALVARKAGRARELDPPNNARALAMRVYETDLGTLDRLVASDVALGRVIAAVVDAARGADDPLERVKTLDPATLQIETTRLDFRRGWSPWLSRWTPCSDGWHAGCASSATTSPTARTSTVRSSCGARVTTDG